MTVVPTCISLVVPIRNEEHSLPSLIESILKQSRPPNEVLLVDGGSLDDSISIARKLTSRDSRFRVIEAGPATPGRGRNVGIAAAACDWIALTDAGIQLDSDWLEELVRVVIKESDVRVVFGNFEPVTESFFEQCAALAYVPPPRLRPGGRMRGPSTASALLHRDAWAAVGGFPDLRASEDIVFFERIEAHGVKVGWAPNALARWELQPTIGSTFRKFVLYSKHNVWAGRQRDWHYGLLRQYLIALPFVVLGIVWSPLWLLVPVFGFLGRIAKAIYRNREGHSLFWLLNPVQFLGVGLILAVLDIATFIGWVQAVIRPASTENRVFPPTSVNPEP